MQTFLQNLNEKLKLNNELNYQLLMSQIILNLSIDKKDKELLFLLLQNRDKNYIRINHNEGCFENVKSYLRLLRPLKLPRKNLTRIGGKNDGGYVMHSMGGGFE
ncbi:hypothetical protein [Campylobacter sp. LR286c]|uniref:hypothetical protein n=1 Tax=Campylobacter sp. LR286c TaxID=2593545 RepID=UPI001CC2121F|nr:hypothetical protein [Campylobacter sp. LR286c]